MPKPSRAAKLKHGHPIAAHTQPHTGTHGWQSFDEGVACSVEAAGATSSQRVRGHIVDGACAALSRIEWQPLGETKPPVNVTRSSSMPAHTHGSPWTIHRRWGTHTTTHRSCRERRLLRLLVVCTRVRVAVTSVRARRRQIGRSAQLQELQARRTKAWGWHRVGMEQSPRGRR